MAIVEDKGLKTAINLPTLATAVNARQNIVQLYTNKINKQIKMNIYKQCHCIFLSHILHDNHV